MTTLFTEAGLVKAGREAKDALQRSAVLINGEAIGVDQNMQGQAVFDREKARFGKYFLVKLGKKKHHIFTL